MTKLCCECRDGEHENYDDDVKLVTVRSEDGKLRLRGYICASHWGMLAEDGYVIRVA